MTECVVPDWPAQSNVCALTTTRLGGCSHGAFASMNLALHVGDDARSVLRNRESLVRTFALPGTPVWLEQVHGTSVVAAQRYVDQDKPPQADGAWTDATGVVCCVMTADCLPVLLCDDAGTRVGIAHAGWRGLLGGIIAASVAAMAPAAGGSALMAWLGPAISQASYEVGADVREAFLARDAAATVAFAPNARGRWQADLYTLARAALARVGVERVYGGDFCTLRDTRRFFSHRREAPCGRMASLIWLESG